MANSEKFNAALLHVYGYNEDQRPDRENKHPAPVRPDIRGRLVISAAKELKKVGLVEHLEESKGAKIKRKWSLSNDAYEKYKELLNT